MRQCGDHLQEALALGRLVLHRSGEEGIDELWGEPFKAFAFPIEDFYKSRYVKIAATMRDVDRICDALAAAFDDAPMFAGLEPSIEAFARAAKVKCETLQTDAEIFDAWSSFVSAAETLSAFQPLLSQRPSLDERLRASHGLQLVAGGKELVSSITRARANAEEHARVHRAPGPVSGRLGPAGLRPSWPSAALEPGGGRVAERGGGLAWPAARASRRGALLMIETRVVGRKARPGSARA